MRALIVEDYLSLRTAIANAMKIMGWAVDSSDNGKEGLWYAQGNVYDVIILDLMLPGMSGLEVLRNLRNNKNEVPVLILTAKTDVSDRVAGLDAGADDYLAKPFAMSELMARVRSIVRRNGPTRAPAIHLGGLCIDSVHKAVSYDNEPVELSPREFALLEYLASRMGEVVSRTDIWEHVYDFHADCQSNVVDVYIGYLRKKLEAGNKPRLIQTRRGYGYQLALQP